MTIDAALRGTMARLAGFTVSGSPPPAARARAAEAVLDTVGVMLAGAVEPAARIVQATLADEGPGRAVVAGTALRLSPSNAALANGTAAHALDYDDMCFVSLAHPSAPLAAAALATAEQAHAAGAALVDAYVVGFEIEARLGTAMNPRHYERGWHCTSTLGTIGAAAAASRLLGLDAGAAGHALAIAASEASGLKENFGTMVKPLHAGLAARNGVLAAALAARGLQASEHAIDGRQGFLTAMDSRQPSIEDGLSDLGDRWEIVETGITVKLYPSCAGTHPTLDALLDLRRADGFTSADVDRVEVTVDSITPTVLIYDRPATALEGKFSMPFCTAAAIVDGQVTMETFSEAKIADPAIAGFLPRVAMRVDPALDATAPPLTQSRVRVHLKNGRVLEASANGARGYPERPPSIGERAAKFRACAARVLPGDAVERALALAQEIERLTDVCELMDALAEGTVNS